MKTIDIFCASQASTTIMDSDIHNQPSSSAATTSGGGRAIDRHNPIIQDEKRLSKTLLTPPLFTTTTTSNHNNNKNKSKNLKNKTDTKRKKNLTFADENNDETYKNVVRKQGAGVLLGWSCTKPGDFISPATSSRFLLADKTLMSDQHLFDPLLKQVSTPLAPPPPPPQLMHEKLYKSEVATIKDDAKVSSSPVKTPPPRTSSSLSSRSSDHQVVVLRVSLHCKGCEKKMRKHISKMEGVTSFNIDFMAKKVTVVGDITPLAVLTSVSKVKNAKLLTPTTISSSTVPQTDSNFSDIKKQLGLVS